MKIILLVLTTATVLVGVSGIISKSIGINRKVELGLSVLIAVGLLFASFITVLPINTVAVIHSPFSGIQGEAITSENSSFHLVSPFSKVYSMPTDVQTYRSGAPVSDSQVANNELVVQTQDNAYVSVVGTIQYAISHEKAPQIIREYKDHSGLHHKFLVPTIQRTLERVASEYSVKDFASNKKTEVLEKFAVAIAKEFETVGIEYRGAAFNDVVASAEVEAAMGKETQEKLNADAERARQEVIRLAAESAKIQAQGEADKRLIEAEAEAKANELIANSISETLTDYMEAEARKQHGWYVTQGSSNVIVDAQGDN